MTPIYIWRLMFMSEPGRLLCRDAVGHSGSSQQPSRGRTPAVKTSQDLTLHAVLSEGTIRSGIPLSGGEQTAQASANAFYEKVIKVKADVAAYLIICFPSA